MTHTEFIAEFAQTRRDPSTGPSTGSGGTSGHSFYAAVASAQAIDREAVYVAALKALDRLDPYPARFRGCRVAGRLCLSLDEVVRAVEDA